MILKSAYVETDGISCETETVVEEYQYMAESPLGGRDWAGWKV